MGFGGKRRGATGQHGRPWAHHANGHTTRAQRRIRHAERLKREATWANAWAGLQRRYQGPIEKAINGLLLDETLAMGLDASMAPRRVIGVDPATETKLDRVQRVVIDALVEALCGSPREKMQALGRDAARSLMSGIVCSAAVVIPGDDGGLDALGCTLPTGHPDCHVDKSGAKWEMAEPGSLRVQLPGKIEHVTAEVRVKT